MGDLTSAGRLRSLPSLAGPLPEFDPDTAPADPDLLFEQWLADAIGEGVAEPHLVAPEWTVYHVLAEEVEFWQGDERRRHVRLRYTRDDGRWGRDLLWP